MSCYTTMTGRKSIAKNSDAFEWIVNMSMNQRKNKQYNFSSTQRSSEFVKTKHFILFYKTKGFINKLLLQRVETSIYYIMQVTLWSILLSAIASKYEKCDNLGT